MIDWRKGLMALLALLLVLPARAEASGEPRRRALPVSVSGAPRSLVTLVVPVPQDLADAERVQFEVVLSGAVAVMGRLTGDLLRSERGGVQPLLLTLRVPSTALIGLLDVADVVFAVEDGRSVAVPIILRVPAVRSVIVSGLREVRDLESGDRVELVYRVRNLGNAVERLRVEIAANPALAARSLDGPQVSLAPYGEATVTVALRVPPANGAQFPVALSLVREDGFVGDSIAAARTILQVASTPTRLPGVTMNPFYGVAASRDGTASAGGFRIAGPVSDSIDFSLDLALPPQGQGLGVLGLSTLGVVRQPFQATLGSASWRASAGIAAADFGALSGMAPNGEGVVVHAPVFGSRVEALAARPHAGLQSRGHFTGVRATFDVPVGQMAVGITSLRERSGFLPGAGRALDALAVEIGDVHFGAVSSSAGLALRDVAGGRALGYRVGVAQNGLQTRWSASVVQTPGGANGFAASESMWMLDARHEYSRRLALSANAQQTRDGNAIVRSFAARTVGVGAQYALTPQTTWNLRLNSAESELSAGAGSGGSFGNEQLSIGTDLSTMRGAWQFSANLRLSAISRFATLVSGATNRSSAQQRQTGIGVSRDFQRLGRLDYSNTLVETGRGGGAAPWQLNQSLRWSDLTVSVGNAFVRFGSEIETISNSLSPTGVILRGDVSTTLRSGVDIGGSVERNPFLLDRSGRVGVIAAVRVGVSATAFEGVLRTTERVVFVDENGDGRRDPGERGVGGVVFHFANYRFVSSRSGTFKVPRSMRGRLRADLSSIPTGLLLHPRYAADTVERVEIPLVATSRATLQLRLEQDDQGRVPNVDLANADVWLRDAEGFEWVGMNVGGGKFLFTDLPSGRYVMRTSTARLSEPVRIEESTLLLRAGDDLTIDVPVRGRAVRIITPPRQGGRGGVGPRGGSGSRSGPDQRSRRVIP
ncbi:hypothetical protein Strain138_001231 [Pseudogemmatithrix spongiicola]|uniref:Carboxypeptidase regulatory-like domain-containing protein n=1 Tax=Pseudogemmatithrix spongiicola TaxID=3062599 RepID=A0AA49JZS2_9BACT|nr:hypothetical protein Strain138_001231 [Gemmatimonadaceae bacterium 'strain 138']WKW14870.1 hypothetical protein Strain318_001231 [Gemmatimonadaceae bacterium 'strain 318']